MVKLVSEVTIDGTATGGKKFQFTGVNDVRIKRSIHSYVDTATLKVPSIARIKTPYSTTPVLSTFGKQISDGDKITIKLGYDGVLVTEFEGFIKRRDLNMPLQIECEGYCRQLRLNNSISKYYKHTTVKELLQEAVKGTDIAIEVAADSPISDLRLIKASGADICDEIKKLTEGTINVFFKEPKLLYAGLIYTAFANGANPLNQGHVSYRLGWNVVKDNNLKERVIEDNPVQVLFNGKLPTGEKLFTSSNLKKAASKLKRLLINIPSEAWLKQFAQEKEYHMNYTGYEGKINAFLLPYAYPGYTANIKDSRYPEHDGTYVLESTEVLYNTQGARRIVEVGVKVGFAA